MSADRIRLNEQAWVRQHLDALVAPHTHDNDMLADTLSVDLRPLDAPYCELMRAVWADVPVTWEGLHPVAAAPPGVGTAG